MTWDEAFGRATDVRDRIARLHLWCVAEVPHAMRVWPHRPAIVHPPWSGQSCPPTPGRLVAWARDPVTVDQRAIGLPAFGWTRPMIQEGSQGHLGTHMAA